MIEEAHCSQCVWYESVCPFMWCKKLQRRITARKSPCKYYQDYSMKDYAEDKQVKKKKTCLKRVGEKE